MAPKEPVEAVQLFLMSIRIDGDWIIPEKSAKHVKNLLDRIKEVIEENAIKSI